MRDTRVEAERTGVPSSQRPEGFGKWAESGHRGTSHKRKSQTPRTLDMYFRSMLRVLRGFSGSGRFLIGEVPLYHGQTCDPVWVHARVPDMSGRRTTIEASHDSGPMSGRVLPRG